MDQIDIPDLLAALKQATEERDRFAAALERSRTSFTDIAGRFKRHDVLKSDLAGIATAALSEVSDLAECLKARDAEQAIPIVRECAAAMCKRCAQGEPVKADRAHGDYAHALGPVSEEHCNATPIWTRYALFAPQADSEEGKQ